MSESSSVVVGGGYVENPDFVPNPADLTGQFNTSGTGAHQVLDASTEAFAIDRQRIAEQVVAALDPSNLAVPSSSVILPNLVETNEAAIESILAKAESIAASPVEVGVPSPQEQAAGEDTGRDADDSLPVENGVRAASPEPVGNTSTANQATTGAKVEAEEAKVEEAPVTGAKATASKATATKAAGK